MRVLLTFLFAVNITFHAGAQDQAASAKELVEVRNELVKALNETRAAYHEEIKTRRDFVTRYTNELATLSTAVESLQNQLKTSEKRLSALEAENTRLKQLLTTKDAELRKLIAVESQSRVDADKKIIGELTKAIGQGMESVQDAQARALAAAQNQMAAQVAAAQATAAQAAQASAGSAPGGAALIYTVVPGDTLSAIATAFNLSVDDLKRLNNLTSDVIRVGQKLKIPEN